MSISNYTRVLVTHQVQFTTHATQVLTMHMNNTVTIARQTAAPLPPMVPRATSVTKRACSKHPLPQSMSATAHHIDTCASTVYFDAAAAIPPLHSPRASIVSPTARHQERSSDRVMATGVAWKVQRPSVVVGAMEPELVVGGDEARFRGGLHGNVLVRYLYACGSPLRVHVVFFLFVGVQGMQLAAEVSVSDCNSAFAL